MRKRFIENAPVRVTGFSGMEQDAVSHISKLLRSSYTQEAFAESVWPGIDQVITELHEK